MANRLIEATVPDDAVSLFVSGKKYEGWIEAQISMNLRAIAGAFSLAVTDTWTGQSKPWPIVPGNRCELFIGKDQVIDGFVDSASPSFSEKSQRRLSIAGRDKTADLVDCSAETATGTLQNVTLEQLARAFCAQFGIGVIVKADVGKPFVTVKVDIGESWFDVLDKCAKRRGVLLYSDGKGNLVLDTVGKTVLASGFEQGVNILGASGIFDNKDRYSRYIVKSQLSGGDGQALEASFGVRGEALDPGVTRPRTLIIKAESQSEGVTAERRAQWEANTRYGKAQKVTLTTEGFRKKNGALWTMNEIAPVKAAALGVNRRLLISGVRFHIAPKTVKTTTFELEPKEAYDQLPKLSKADLLDDLVTRGKSGGTR